MTIIEWFDPTKIEHLSAYRYLMNHGTWPEDFLPKDLEFENLWQVQIANKLAKLYIKEKTGY